MSTQLYLAQGLVNGRIHTDQDSALTRTVELDRQARRAVRRQRVDHHR